MQSKRRTEKEGQPMNVEEIKKVLVVGSGTMGRQIGFLCAMNGYDVALYDLSEELLAKAMARIRKMADGYVKAGRLSQTEADAAIRRIFPSSDPERAGRDADFISESVPEDPALKGEVFALFNRICPERAIFTTNTSTLLPSMFAEATGRPDRFAAFHFHDVRFTNLVDIMPHPGTAEATVGLIEEFAYRIGQNPVTLKKESGGYVFNAMLSAWLDSAETLAENEVSSVEDIDRSWMTVFHMPIGPFGIIDSIGLETVWKVNDFWATRLKHGQFRKNADFLKRYIDQGRLGEKTGRGFYEYPDPEYRKPDFTASRKPVFKPVI
jgi:3-hydroxybutyryl-CoA dehydrogenase